MQQDKSNILFNLLIEEVKARVFHNFIDTFDLNFYQRDLLHQVVSVKSCYDRAYNFIKLLS